jgi:uncharacterized protein (DUF1501 family)
MSATPGISRRDVLKCSALLPGLVTLPRPFASAAGLLPPDPEGRVLVVVQLTGGNDGLNTVVPFADDVYHRARPVLAVPPSQVVRLSDDTGLSPALAALAPLWDGGRLAVVRGAGPPQPDRSHFRSMEIWHTASLADPAPTTGWIGALAQRSPGEGVPVVRAGGRDLPAALAGAPVQAPALASLDDVLIDSAARGPAPAQRARLQRACCAAGRQGEAAFLADAYLDAFDCAERLHTLRASSRGDFPGGELGRALELSALLIGARLGLRVLYVTQDGYDTHARQQATQSALLRDLGAALAAFDSRLAAQGDGDRVVVLVFTEFGRRIHENASGGTDHGAANPVLLLGAPVRPGLHGEPPALSDSEDADVPVTLDFRHIYAAALDWLGIPPSTVLPGNFAPAPILRT